MVTIVGWYKRENMRRPRKFNHKSKASFDIMYDNLIKSNKTFVLVSTIEVKRK
jgi:hypothetical protein